MKLKSGTRIGQSGHELMLAVFLSLILHICVATVALLLYFDVTPKVFVPPFYEVKLVGQPAEIAPAPVKEAIPPVSPPMPPAIKPTPKPKAAKAHPAVKKATPKPAPREGTMPELPKQKQAPEEVKPAETPAGPSQSPPAGAAPGTASAGIAITTPQQEFKFPYYLGQVRLKIGQNWRPPPDAKDATARVIFTINRSGVLVSVDLDDNHSKGTYMFKLAAMRAIQSSNPFPPLPDEFPDQTLNLSVDLMAE